MRVPIHAHAHPCACPPTRRSVFFHVRNLPKYWHEAPYAARQRAKHAREKADAKRTTKAEAAMAKLDVRIAKAAARLRLKQLGKEEMVGITTSSKYLHRQYSYWKW